MEQINSNSPGEPQSERRSDSSRWRADAEVATERARREEQRALQERREHETEPAPELERAPEAEPAPAHPPTAAEGSTDPLWQRWWEIQSSFVDDPRSSLAEAHALVSGVVDRAVRQLQEQRNQLEQGWSNGREVSTDDLRRGLQGYREFLGRLLSRTTEGLA